MGATLPTLTRYLTRDAEHLSDAFGRLYAANTLGAIVGTIVAGFILIELVGLTGTLVVGAACSGVAGAIAIALDRRVAPSVRPTPAPTSMAAAAGGEPSRLRLALLVAFVSGLTSLGYQTLWTRLLASGTGNSTYVFTMILALFLIGIAAGAIAFNVIRPRIRSTVGLLALAQLATAALVLIGGAIVIPAASVGILRLQDSPGELFGLLLPTTALVVLPATFIMGLSFPAASGLVGGPDARVGSRAGLLLSANTLGAITGTFLVPFVVIPAVGSPAALGLIAIVNVGLAIALALRGGVPARLSRAILTSGRAAVAVVRRRRAVGRRGLRRSIGGPVRRSGGRGFASAEDEIASVQAGRLPDGMPSSG